MVLATVALWPYQSGNTLVDVLLWCAYSFGFGALFTLGARVVNKVL